jgi:acetyltransferase-like isoleucine patch superfamily enzyme
LIRQGVEWLDASYPEWRTKVDWNTVDMADARYDLWGQLLDHTIFPHKPGKGVTPRNGWDVIFFYLKAEVDRQGAFDWLQLHGFMESTEAWRNTVGIEHPSDSPHVELGVDVWIGPYTVVGWPGQAREPKVKPMGRVRIGDHAVIHEHVEIQSGIHDTTVIGDHVYLMGFTHVAHDSQLGDWVTMAGHANLGGHTVLEDYTWMGSHAVTNQRARLRAGSLLGANSFLKGDTDVWSIYVGSPARRVGVNQEGVDRFERGYYT